MAVKLHVPDEAESQPALWEGEVVRRRPTKPRVEIGLNTTSLQKTEAERSEPWPVSDYASSPVVTWMYVTHSLQAVLLTGRELGMPTDQMAAVFPEDGPDAKPRPCTRLTRELFFEILQQLDQTSERALGEERAAKMRERWDAIRQWAEEEGWTR